MGSPKHQRKKYSRPKQHWNKLRIEEENKLIKKYGLNNKKEIWKIESKITNIRTQVKKIIKNIGTTQAKLEEKQLLEKLDRLNLLPKDSKIEDAFSLKIEDILERRLQTIITKLGFANTQKQARQFIIHGHIFLNAQKITVPSYIVKKGEEQLISFNLASKIAISRSSEETAEQVIKENTSKGESIIA